MTLIFLYGPAAAGKLTIGRALSAATGFALFHNHLIVDALTAVFPFGSEPFVRLREQFWLATIEEAAKTDRSMVFTFTPEPSVSVKYPWRARELVESLGGSVRFVQLTISHEEQERRLENDDRAEFGKLRSVSVLREIRARESGWRCEMPAPDLVIDTEQASADAACGLIVSEFGLSS
jgi:hypothetical protein